MGATALRRGAPAVLPPEIDFEQLAFSPADLMLLDVQKFDAQVIATAFGVPAAFINMPIEGGLNYTTPVLGLEQWWRTELRPTAFRISRALSLDDAARRRLRRVRRPRLPGAQPSPSSSTRWVALAKDGHVTTEEVRAAVLGMPPQTTEQEVLDALTVPPSAGASPQSQPSEVIPLRPTQAVTT